MRKAMSSDARRVRREAGFTLVELSVAMVIALFLLAGLFTIEQSTRNTSSQQTLLAQLQDNQRLAMTIMTDVIQAGGYFADPTQNTGATALPSVSAALFPIPGMGIYGTTTPGQPDSVYVQYMSEGPNTDNMILCDGQQTAAVAPGAPGIAYINQFSVDPVRKQLLCTVSTNIASAVVQLTNPPVVLVDGAVNKGVINGVEKLQMLYGVATTGTNGNSVDTYMTAAQVTAANKWPDVSSVKVTLTFSNPLFGQPGQAQQTVSFERVIGIMSRAGDGA
jgi:type IV pilus assembly protein PilW